MNSYVHVLDADGKRITSIVDDMLSPVGETELIEVKINIQMQNNMYMVMILC